jgi:hypothetical protein
MQKLLSSIFLLASLAASRAEAAPLELLCELGQRLSVVGDVIRDNAIELGWKGSLYRMQRVGTSTGAQRFEDPISGLIWISIPDKAMLLDGSKGEPVANGCRTRSGTRSVR